MGWLLVFDLWFWDFNDVWSWQCCRIVMPQVNWVSTFSWFMYYNNCVFYKSPFYFWVHDLLHDVVFSPCNIKGVVLSHDFASSQHNIGNKIFSACLPACLSVCLSVYYIMRACVRACVRARACVCTYVCVSVTSVFISHACNKTYFTSCKMLFLLSWGFVIWGKEPDTHFYII